MAGAVPHHELSFFLILFEQFTAPDFSVALTFCWSFRYHCSGHNGHRHHAARASCWGEWLATGDIGGSSEATMPQRGHSGHSGMKKWESSIRLATYFG